MQEATTLNIFYDGLSIQHLGTLLVSVFTLCYGSGLRFRGPFCIKFLGFAMQKWLLEYSSILRLCLHFLSCFTGGSEYNHKTPRSETGNIQNTKQISIPPQNFLKQSTSVRYYKVRTNLFLFISTKGKKPEWTLCFLTLRFRPWCWVRTPNSLPTAEFGAKYYCACTYGVTNFTPLPLLDSSWNLNTSFNE
jgi:hypothetical protein